VRLVVSSLSKFSEDLGELWKGQSKQGCMLDLGLEVRRHSKALMGFSGEELGWFE
jgi:hypothetical protein